MVLFDCLAEPEISRDRINGEIIYVDRFGNAITNIGNEHLARFGKSHVLKGGKRLCAIQPYYQSVPTGKPVAVPGSSGFLEISINGGSASKSLRLEIGTVVSLR